MSSFNRGNAPAQSDSIRLIRFDEQRAHNAWEAHRAMLFAEQHNPALKLNPAWLALRADAFENFELAFSEGAA